MDLDDAVRATMAAEGDERPVIAWALVVAQLGDEESGTATPVTLICPDGVLPFTAAGLLHTALHHHIEA